MKLKICTDGGCRTNSSTEPGPASCAFVAYDQDDHIVGSLNEALVAPNNVAEYRGLLLALKHVEFLMGNNEVDQISFFSDSQLLVNQMQGHWRTKDPNLKGLQQQAKQQIAMMDVPVDFNWVPREQNTDADFLCNLALDGTIKTDLSAPLPVKVKKQRGISAGQLFKLHRLTEARPLRVDQQGYAICGGCQGRIITCTCPPLEEAA
jgi:ribonuclease HI